MDEKLHAIFQAIRQLNDFLLLPSPLRAVVVGLLLSWTVSQALKFHPSFALLSDEGLRLLIRLMSFWLAFLPVVLMWPGPSLDRFIMAVITGAFSPTAYTVLVRMAYHFAPWLEPKLSARPGAGS